LKDPRYFAISFRRFFKNFVNDGNLQAGIYELKFSKPERVHVLQSTIVPSGRTLDMITYARQGLSTASGVVFEKEVYVRGNAAIGQNNDLRALVCDGDVSLAENTILHRWLDAEGNIRADGNCNLGVSLTCGQECLIAAGCVFRRLYGAPVRVAGEAKKNSAPVKAINDAETEVLPPADAGRHIEDVWPYSDNHFSIITHYNLHVATSSRILGHIKTYGNLNIEDNVLITGNVFAEGDVFIGRFCKILGDIFAQGRISVGEGTQIGRPGTVKSVVGNQAVFLSTASAVYGYVTTEGDGRAL
jgi:NDP-sugar pyrophosphorylase family protein